MKILVTHNHKLTHMFHIADIHIRLLKRHDEYQQVFDDLINQIQNHPLKSSSGIVVAGDILHSKTELTPECI